MWKMPLKWSRIAARYEKVFMIAEMNTTYTEYLFWHYEGLPALLQNTNKTITEHGQARSSLFMTKHEWNSIEKVIY